MSSYGFIYIYPTIGLLPSLSLTMLMNLTSVINLAKLCHFQVLSLPFYCYSLFSDTSSSGSILFYQFFINHFFSLLSSFMFPLPWSFCISMSGISPKESFIFLIISSDDSDIFVNTSIDHFISLNVFSISRSSVSSQPQLKLFFFS